MRIASRVSIGYASLIALMVLILAYQLSLIHQMQGINRDLSRVNFRSAELSRNLQYHLFEALEDRRKLIASGDPAYERLWSESRQRFESDLARLESLELSEGERRQLGAVRREWRDLVVLAQTQSDQIARWPGLSRVARLEQVETLTAINESTFERTENEISHLIGETQAAIRSRVAQSAAAGERAQWVSWGAAGAFVLISIVVSVLVVRSISSPLLQLTQGTREIAKGRFDYRLRVQGAAELSQLAEDFNNMAARLRELDEMKKDFVSHVSHELKSPLASMQETVRLMLEGLPGPLTDKQRRLLELTYQSARRLMSMIRNLLDLARVEAGVMEYEFSEVDLRDLARTVVSEFEPQLRTKNLEFEALYPERPVIVRCDGDRIIQVISNLVSNAFKYSPKGSHITVRISTADGKPEIMPSTAEKVLNEAVHGFAVVSVSDRGPGIPEAHRERIFERFHQVREGGRSSNQGVGLGLAISRSIIEAHGGAIWVDSREGEGSTFHFLLEQRPTSDAESAAV